MKLISDMRAIKMIFFDMEGTLISKEVRLSSGKYSKTIWAAIAEILGKDALKEEEETIRKWKRKGYKGYLDWMEDTIQIHLKYGLGKAAFESLLEGVEFCRGVKKSFEVFDSKNVKTALLTGGFKQMADKVQKELNINYAVSSCEYFWNPDGRLSYWNLIPCYEKGKASVLRSIVKDLGLKMAECAFIGDSEDDVYPAREVGVSVAFNGPKELRKVCTFEINQAKGNEDFQDVLQYL